MVNSYDNYENIKYAYLLYQSDGTFKCSKCGRRYSKVNHLTHCPKCRAEIINSERSTNNA